MVRSGNVSRDTGVLLDPWFNYLEGNVYEIDSYFFQTTYTTTHVFLHHNGKNIPLPWCCTFKKPIM